MAPRDDVASRAVGNCMGRFKAFVKMEKLPGFEKGDGKLGPTGRMADRLIQGPNDATHGIAGPV